jgi:hypothetical protein
MSFVVRIGVRLYFVNFLQGRGALSAALGLAARETGIKIYWLAFYHVRHVSGSETSNFSSSSRIFTK